MNEPTPQQPLQPMMGHANFYPAAHLINPTTLLALHRLADHENRRKHRKRKRLTRQPREA